MGEAGKHYSCPECGKDLILIAWDRDKSKAWLPKHPLDNGYTCFELDAIKEGLERFDKLGYRVI